MSVIMSMRVKGDPNKLEQFAQQNSTRLLAIVEDAKEHGVIAHRFYADDGEIMVLDEWPDAESFQQFFEHMSPDIQAIMSEVGVQSEPEIRFWRKLDTGDDVGWGA